MIDDDEEDFIIIRDIITEIDHHKYTIEWVASYDNGLKSIRAGKHDVYLVDYQLGARNGIELIREVIAKGCDAPLILLTGQNNIEIDHEALNSGASDYLVKGTINARQLESSLRYSIVHARALKSIKELNAALEKRVRDRTMILEEAVTELEKTKNELSQALEKEKELNELKSRFVSMASHEFRTPLATILSSLSLISKYIETNEKEKQARHIEKIKSSITHMTDILNDVLSVSKLEEGKFHASPENTDLQDFITPIVHELQTVAKKDQHIRYKHSGAKSAMLDKKILRNILFNLISNAIKFSPEGKPIEISTKSENGHIELSIKDNGIGIAEEDQKHLFERFFRGQNVTNIQGTGLGLNIVAKYVELMNGSIDFKSTLEKGTIFNITLPNHHIS
jgi:signal transduction histidine kinase